MLGNSLDIANLKLQPAILAATILDFLTIINC